MSETIATSPRPKLRWTNRHHHIYPSHMQLPSRSHSFTRRPGSIKAKCQYRHVSQSRQTANDFSTSKRSSAQVCITAPIRMTRYSASCSWNYATTNHSRSTLSSNQDQNLRPIRWFMTPRHLFGRRMSSNNGAKESLTQSAGVCTMPPRETKAGPESLRQTSWSHKRSFVIGPG